MSLHVGAQNRVDAGLVAGFAAVPAEQIGVETHGNDFFWSGKYKLGSLPEVRIGSASVRVGVDTFAYIGSAQTA
jgi:hypothetical protein